MRTGVKLASDAPIATIARVKEWERHPVTLFEWTSHRVCLDAFAEGVNHSRELVTDNAVRMRRHIASPDVKIGTADHRVRVLD